MSILNEGIAPGEFLLSEAPLYRSRELINVASGSPIAGTILTRTALAETGTLTAVAKSGGNTGNGVFTADPSAPVGTGGKPGVYTARVITAGTNSATFRVDDPEGAVIGDFSYSGSGAVGSFNDQIKFTITDGSTDFVVGDGFDITVGLGAGANQSDTYTAAVAGGSADAVLYSHVDASAAAAKGVGFVRDCEVHGEFLTFPASSTDAQKRAFVASLKRRGIIVRWTNPPVA